MDLNENEKKPSNLRLFFSAAGATLPILSVLGISGVVTAVVWYGLSPKSSRTILNKNQELIPSMYTHDYPANRQFQTELQRLREKGRLKAEDEVLIHRSVLASTDFLKMPPAVLWCLLFQESRLNHLEGIEGERGAYGLGQFSYYSFFEINHQMERYGEDNLNLIVQLLGRDVRPIDAKRKNLHHPSSYYYIPTAVVSSAVYLNHRYIHLQRLLEKREIPYNPDLLWLYAGMAYNKGTRSILSLWNNARKMGGEAQVRQLVNNNNLLYASMHNQALITKALKRIWPLNEARAYAKELRIHSINLKECSVATSPETQHSFSSESQK